MTIDPAGPLRATIATEKGDIVIDLFPRDAPVAVNNFVFLARSGWYDDNTFHYVLPGYLAQTGDPSGTGRGSPGVYHPGEHDNGPPSPGGTGGHGPPAGHAGRRGQAFSSRRWRRGAPKNGTASIRSSASWSMA